MTDDTTNNDGKQKPVNLLTSQQSFIQDDKSVVRKPIKLYRKPSPVS